MLEPGAVLDGRYEVIALLAAGGMGEVFRARRRLLGDEVAIKVLRPGGRDPEGLRERFLQEARICAQLRHPHIVSVLDFDIDPEGRPFLVMELLNGPSLADELEAGGTFDVDRLGRVMGPICTAIQAAHDRNVLHRDLKPGNIVSHRFDSGEVVYKVVDFGLANLRESEDVTRLTREGQFLGTVGYASPEQLRGEAVDARSDIYSLGLIVFELLTGRRPFESEDVLGLVTQHLTTRPPLPSTLRPGLPEWIDQAVERALAKDREGRWEGAAAFGRALIGPVIGAGAPSPRGLPQAVTDRYEVGASLGSGRLGSEIFGGVHRALGHPVAIRILRRRPGAPWEAIRGRCLQEARIMQVAHPSIVQVRDYGETDDAVYVVTDLFQGESLRERLDREPRPALDRVIRFVRQIAEAAGVIHGRGGLVGGLHPGIIRITHDQDGERVVISSGGIAQLQDVLGTASEDTLRGLALKDPEILYLPPELFQGRPLDGRGDVHTIGVLAYELLTGRPPVEAATWPVLIASMLGRTAPDPRQVRTDLPDALAAPVVRCLAVDPGDRFPTLRAFLAEWPVDEPGPNHRASGGV